jgi:hypothetical protein
MTGWKNDPKRRGRNVAPYKSESQKKLFNAKVAKGEMDPAVAEEFEESSEGMKLPKKVAKKAGRPPKSIADMKAAAKKMTPMEEMPQMKKGLPKSTQDLRMKSMRLAMGKKK